MAEQGLIKITGLWKNKDKFGNTYFSGYMGSAKVLIFKNKYKEKDNQPDYNMYVAPKKEESGERERDEGTGAVSEEEDF